MPNTGLAPSFSRTSHNAAVSAFRRQPTLFCVFDAFSRRLKTPESAKSADWRRKAPTFALR
eukprot:5558900-Alexandrium_andersonii.AAC.1